MKTLISPPLHTFCRTTWFFCLLGLVSLAPLHAQDSTPFGQRQDGSEQIKNTNKKSDESAPGKEQKETDFAKKFTDLCTQYEKTLITEITKQNNRDKPALERLLQKSNSAGEVDCSAKIMKAAESVSNNKYISSADPSGEDAKGASRELGKELWKIKTERDKALRAAARIASGRHKRDFEELQRQALKGNDMTTAKAAAKKLETLDEITTSPFTGTWKASWTHPTLIIIKDNGTVSGWSDRSFWRQGKKASELEFYNRGSKWTSVCVISEDENTLNLPDGSGKLWRQQ